MKRQTFEKNCSLSSLCWHENTLIDGITSTVFHSQDGTLDHGGIHYAYDFDRSIASADGRYVLIYKNLGTKGLLLKDREFLREINRSFYHADVYEYPAIFWTRHDGTTYLVHCPNEYCQLDIEDADTGTIVSSHAERNPSDFFHSRLAIGPDGKTLVSHGWYWHPYDFIGTFDLETCFDNPLLLDKAQASPDIPSEIQAASFIDGERLLVGACEDADGMAKETLETPGQIYIWNVLTNSLSLPLDVHFGFGVHMAAIDATYAWDLYRYPKIFNYHTGKIVDTCQELFTGMQQSSIIHHLNDLPQAAFNRRTGQMAVLHNYRLDILTPEKQYEE